MSADVADRRIPQWTLGDRLRKARESASLEQGQLGSLIGVNRGTISRVERGLNKPRQAVVIAWAAETGVDKAWLQTGVTPTDSTKESWLPAPGTAADVADRMQAAVGNVIASDESIRRVLSLETVAEMKADERFLAWMLVTASDADPERVGLSDEDVPTFFDADQLRDALCLHGGSNPGPKD